MAATWWDPRGPMAPLHKLNPVRLAYIRDRAAERFGRDPKLLGCLKGLRMLDIGCGAGILSEPLARLGADLVGVDPAAENIEAARLHAADGGVAVDYRATTAEALAEAGERFDVVLAMEVVEHVVDVPAFVATCASMVKPGGLLIDGDAQPHAEELRAGDRRRRIRAALAAARHAPVGQIRQAGRAGDGDRGRPGSRSSASAASSTIRSPTAGNCRRTWTSTTCWPRRRTMKEQGA